MESHSKEYTERLDRLASAWWKKLLPVQLPYAYKIKKSVAGPTLEIGCGTGRLLRHLPAKSLGVDTNPHMVQRCRDQGLEAFSPDELEDHAEDESFSSLLCAHVVEHMTASEAEQLLSSYRRYLAPHGRLVLITPQERGFASDPTHVTNFDRPAMRSLVESCGFSVASYESFPLPRSFGSRFPYNEHVMLSTKRDE